MCKSHIHSIVFSLTFSLIYHFSIAAFGPNNAPSHVYGIAYYNEHIYFTEPGDRDIYRTNMTGHKTLYLGSYDYLSDLQIVRPRKG